MNGRRFSVAGVIVALALLALGLAAAPAHAAGVITQCDEAGLRAAG
jgi:hypothetical protein